MATQASTGSAVPSVLNRVNRALAFVLGTALISFAGVYFVNGDTLLAILPLILGLASFLFPAFGKLDTFQPLLNSRTFTAILLILLIIPLAGIYYLYSLPALSIRRIEGQQESGQCEMQCIVTIGGKGTSTLALGNQLVVYGPQARLTDSGYTEAPIAALKVFDVQPQIALAQVVLAHQDAQNNESRRLQTGLRVATVDTIDNPLLIPVYGDGFVYKEGEVYVKPGVIPHVGDLIDIVDVKALKDRAFDTITITTGVELIAVGSTGQSAQFDHTLDKRLSPGTIVHIQPITPQHRAEALRDAAMLWPILFQEDFSDNHNGWSTSVSDDKFGLTEKVIRDGLYQMAVTPASPAVGATMYESAKQVRLSNFYAEADVKKVGGAERSNCGIVFRMNAAGDDDHFYFFRIRGDSYSVVGLLPGMGWQSLISWKPSDLIKRGESNNLGVLADGPNFMFFINGEYVDETANTTLAEGEVRLAAQSPDNIETVTCQFDNFQLYNPPAR